MGSEDENAPTFETQRLIAETLRVPLDKTVQEEFTPRQKALLAELENIAADKNDTAPAGTKAEPSD